MFQDSPLTVHPIFKDLYNDLLARFTAAQAAVSDLNSTYTTLNTAMQSQAATIASQGTTIAAQGTTLAGHTSQLASQASTITAQGNTLTSQGNTLTTQGNTIASQGTTIASQGTTIASQGTTIAGHTTTLGQHTASLTQHTTDIGNRLRKDQADTTPFNLGVAPSAAMTDAVRRQELVGGLLRPYRNFKNVAQTYVGATVRSNQDPTIVDSLGLGSAYKITNIRITTVVAPTLSSTITIKSNGTVIYTQTVALTNIPAVGKSFDVLGFTNQYPADVVLPAVLTVNCSAGTFDVFVDGVQV